MAYVIDSKCMACGACWAECLENAIGEGDDIFVIDPDLCNDCGMCTDVCPVNAPKQIQPNSSSQYKYCDEE